MRKIVDCFSIGQFTVLVLDSPPPSEWNKFVQIENIKYETEIAYDFPNAICVKGNGNFKNKNVEFEI